VSYFPHTSGRGVLLVQSYDGRLPTSLHAGDHALPRPEATRSCLAGCGRAPLAASQGIGGLVVRVASPESIVGLAQLGMGDGHSVLTDNSVHHPTTDQ
jgi:hypothetical protein